jgi:histidinol-phosphate aminotransferase
MEVTMNIRSTVRQLARKSYDEESEPLKGDILDCALGRNSFGTSEKVVEFAKHYDWSDLWDVPDTSYEDLKKEICKFWSSYADLETENIKVANGSCVVLSRFNKLFVETGVKVLGYVPQFREYMVEVAVLGGDYEAVRLDPQEGFKFNLERFLGEIKSGYSIIYIDNPNNPTGQLIRLSDIETIVREAAKNETMVILDEAYGDYVEERHSAVNLINQYKNLMVTRTFTKGYGIGRFRVGYAILSTELGNYYDRIDLPFSVSTMGGSLAREALLDQDFIVKLRQQVRGEKGRLTRELSQRGYLIGETCESCPLFILGHKDKDVDLKRELLSKGILTTAGTDWEHLDRNHVRVNTPSRAEDFLARLER